MSSQSILPVLQQKINELNSGLFFQWRHAEKTPADPIGAKIQKGWPIWGKDVQRLKRIGKHWFYAEVTFPKAHAGVVLESTQALIHIDHWCPFTLWIDGEEQFREEHRWFGTGPIFEPIRIPIEPGQTHRLVLRLEPTELSGTGGAGPGVSINYRACVEMAAELDAAAAQLRLAGYLAKTATEKRIVEQAAACIDPADLKANRWNRTCDTITRMESRLQPFSARAKENTVYLLGHSHIDMDWLWRWPDTVSCVRRDFRAITGMMEDYPDLTFIHSQIPTYQVARKMDPDVFRKVQARMAEGRWENGAATWVEGDLAMADGESLARHMLYAAKWSQENLGPRARVFWAPDTFSHPANLPQIARLGEQDVYFHMRCNPGAEDNWPIRNWIGQDGTSIPAVSMCYNAYLTPGQFVDRLLEVKRHGGFRNAMYVWGVGDHGGAMCRFQLELMELYRHKPLIPTIAFGTMGEFVRKVLAEKKPLPQNRGETFPLFEGCFTTNARSKMYNRSCESALLNAEALCAMAGIDRNNPLREAWQQALFNHFHDLLDGAAVNDSYRDVCRRSVQVLAKARKISDEAVAKIVKPARNGGAVAVINPLAFPRTEPVRVKLPPGARCLVDADGAEHPVQRIDGGEFLFIARDVPALSRKDYRVSFQPPREISNIGIEDSPQINASVGEYFRVTSRHAVCCIAKASGVIGSYRDRRTGREYIDYGIPRFLSHTNVKRWDLAMNLFQIIDETPNPMGHWLIDAIVREENLLKAESVKLVDAGPVFARFRIAHKIRSSRIEEEVFFYHDFPRIDCRARVDWREKSDAKTTVPQLKVSFAGSVVAPRARFEGPFTIVERPADGAEKATQKWTDVTGDNLGFTLYNDCKYGTDVLGGRVRLTLLRASFREGFITDNGLHSMRFSFMPHGPQMSNAALERNGLAYNRPLVAVTTAGVSRRHAEGLAIEGNDSVVCTAVRHAEHSKGLIVRLFETNGRPTRIRLRLGRRVRSAREVNFLENPIGRECRASRGAIAAAFRPYEIKTLLVR
jgi:alpha-mannosidase